MKIKIYILLLSFCFLACNNVKEDKSEEKEGITKTDIPFDSTKWKTKDGVDYPFRNKILEDLLAKDTLRHLKKEEVIVLLGQPDRMDNDYLFYRIVQERVGIFPLHTKTLVIKLSKERNSIMIHE